MMMMRILIEMIMLMVILIGHNHDDHDATRIKGLLDWNDNVNSDCLFLKREEVKKGLFTRPPVGPAEMQKAY